MCLPSSAAVHFAGPFSHVPENGTLAGVDSAPKLAGLTQGHPPARSLLTKSFPAQFNTEKGPDKRARESTTPWGGRHQEDPLLPDLWEDI